MWPGAAFVLLREERHNKLGGYSWLHVGLKMTALHENRA
jgi:hypothetical protein